MSLAAPWCRTTLRALDTACASSSMVFPRCWRRLSPLEAAIEQTFVNRDASATLKLGQARGIAMLAPALLGLRIAEYAPNAVKKTVVGAGHSDKGQIRAMVKCLLPRAGPR